MSNSTPGFDDYDLTTGGFSRGSVTSGVYPDNTYPQVDGQLDFEQEKRLQARQEHDKATGARADHPAFTTKGPDATKAEADAAAQA